MDSLKQVPMDVSLADVTNDREALPKSWYVVRVQMKCEKKVQAKLQTLGFEAFVPTQEELHQWSDRKKRVQRILIPMMVFVRLREEDIDAIKRMSFVKGFLCAPDCKQPAIIPQKQIDRLKFVIGIADAPVSTEPLNVKLGDTVQVVRGPLRGLIGNVCETQDGTRLAIVIADVCCLTVKIDISELEKIRV